jgi:hypothetical protein
MKKGMRFVFGALISVLLVSCEPTTASSAPALKNDEVASSPTASVAPSSAAPSSAMASSSSLAESSIVPLAIPLVADPYGLLFQRDALTADGTPFGIAYRSHVFTDRAAVDAYCKKTAPDGVEPYDSARRFLAEFLGGFDENYFAEHYLLAGPLVRSHDVEDIVFSKTLKQDETSLTIAVTYACPEMHDMDEVDTWFAYQMPRDQALESKKIIITIHDTVRDVDDPYPEND